jgi:hypothetical protein
MQSERNIYIYIECRKTKSYLHIMEDKHVGKPDGLWEAEGSTERDCVSGSSAKIETALI